MKTSLEDLQDKLQHWRTSCKHPGRVPSAIKEQIVGSLKYYSRLQVAKATGLSKSTLYGWRQQEKVKSTQVSSTTDFIELDPSFSSVNVTANYKSTDLVSTPTAFNIMMASGIKITLSGYSIEQTASLLKLLSQGE